MLAKSNFKNNVTEKYDTPHTLHLLLFTASGTMLHFYRR